MISVACQYLAYVNVQHIANILPLTLESIVNVQCICTSLFVDKSELLNITIPSLGVLVTVDDSTTVIQVTYCINSHIRVLFHWKILHIIIIVTQVKQILFRYSAISLNLPLGLFFLTICIEYITLYSQNIMLDKHRLPSRLINRGEIRKPRVDIENA